MADLSLHQAKVNGTALTMSPATLAGDTVPIGCMLLVRNGSGAAITCTVEVPGNTKYGLPQPDLITESIPAAGLGIVGPFAGDLANNTDGRVHVTYSSATTVDVAAIRA